MPQCSRSYRCGSTIRKTSQVFIKIRCFFPARGAFTLNRCFSVFMPDGKSFRYCSRADDGLGRWLFWKGLDYEAETLSIFYQIAARSELVIDVGSHTGIYTLLACCSHAQSQVIAFEPVPGNFARLDKNVRVNGWSGRCHLYQSAVSSEQSTVTLFIPKNATLALDASIESTDLDRQKISVPVTTIDHICAGQRVDLVKIDVEGSEAKVLEGMQTVLSNSKPIIVIECLPSGPVKKIQTILAEHGYSFFHLKPEGPVSVDHIAGDYTFRNCLCFPNRSRGILSDWLDHVACIQLSVAPTGD